MKKLFLIVFIACAVFPLYAQEESSQTTQPVGEQEILSPAKEGPCKEGEKVFFISESQTVKGNVVQYGRDVTVAGVVEGDVVVFGGSLVICGKVDGSVVAIGGNVGMHGAISKDVVLIGGDIFVRGNIGGDIVALGGDVDFAPSAFVSGDIVAIGGKVLSQQFAAIGGTVVEFNPARWLVRKAGTCAIAGISAWWFSTFAIFMRLIILALWIAAALIITALFKSRVASAAQNLRDHWIRNFFVGILWIAVGLFLLIVFGLLSIVLIGIPFVFMLLAVWFAMYVFGMTAVFKAFGDKIFSLFGAAEPSPYLTVFIGAAILKLICFIPLLGYLVWFIAGLLGLGACIMSGFGTSQKGEIKINISS